MNKLTQWIYKRRAKYYARLLIEEIKEAEKILDYGAGSGYLGELLSKKAIITMIDIVDYNQTNIPLILYDGNKLPFPDNSFDTTIVIAVLHHTPNPSDAIKEIMRVSNRMILVEEVYKGLLTRLQMDLWEWFWNKTSGITTFYNFHSAEEWNKMFKSLNLKLVSNHKFRSALKNQEMRMFIVEKK